MSDREKLPELIDRFNTGNLTGDELTVLLDMMNHNPRIREEVRLDKELNEILADKDVLELRQKILSVQKNRNKGKGRNFHYLLLAASLLFFIGLEVILLLNTRNHAVSPQTALTQKITPVIKKEPVTAGQQLIAAESGSTGKKIPDQKKDTRLASNFMPNPSYENMIGATRSGGSFRLEKPLTGERFSAKSAILFQWNTEPKTLIELKIMDNQGIIVSESGLLYAYRYTIPQGTLRRGIYYFKIMANDEILYFGKFLVS